jgi:hypothetical protein
MTPKILLDWKRDPLLDSYTAEVPEGTYVCTRNWLDVAVLYFNGEQLRRSGSDGSHTENLKFAEEHLRALRARKEAVCHV